MRIYAVITFWALLAQIGLAQTDSLSDVFPLAVGNTWTYDFRYESISSMPHAFTIDTGTVSYTIVSQVRFPDSTHWEFFERRNFTRSIYGYPYQQTIRDSSSFVIVELHRDRHELYTPQGSPWEFFTFQKAQADSQRFFRFMPTDSLGNANLRIIFPNGALSPPTFRYWLQSHIGMLKMIAGTVSFAYSVGARYYLKEFHPSYPDPHLTVPPSEVTIRTLFGQTKDSSVIVHNRGLQPVLISNITASNNRFVILEWSQPIAPLSEGTIAIRFNPSEPDTMHASIVVYSNSPTSPDTIAMRGEAVTAAVSSLSTSLIDFGIALSGSVRTRSVTIANLGNTPMEVDSVRWKWNRPEFRLTQLTSPIVPQQSGTVALSFTAPPGGPSSTIDSVFLYSNSLTSPDRVMLFGAYLSRAELAVSQTIMDFGSVAVATHKDIIVTITNLMDYAPDISRSALQQSCFFAVNQSAPSILNPQASFDDTIRFAPTSSGIFADTVFYQTSTWGIVTRIDTIALRGNTPDALPTQFYLYQNYPNPFNPATTIKFHIPISSFIILRVFDLLGREVATPVNEELKPGSYERTLHAENLASGVYFYHLTAGNFSQTKKLVLLR